MTEPRVTLAHVRAVQRRGRGPLCLTGVEAWCRRHGIAWAELAGPGVPGEQVLAIGDRYALQALAVARAEDGRHGV